MKEIPTMVDSRYQNELLQFILHLPFKFEEYNGEIHSLAKEIISSLNKSNLIKSKVTSVHELAGRIEAFRRQCVASMKPGHVAPIIEAKTTYERT